jgi:hypothetical protein
MAAEKEKSFSRDLQYRIFFLDFKRHVPAFFFSIFWGWPMPLFLN